MAPPNIDAVALNDECEARLIHTHGVSQCIKDEGHEGPHAGYCDTCVEWEEGDILNWHGMNDDWTRQGRWD